MQDAGYDKNDEDAKDDYDDYQRRARQYLIDATRKNLEGNLEKAKLNKHDVFIVSSSVIFSLVAAKTLEKTTPTIDESRLMESILNMAHARRYGTQASAEIHSESTSRQEHMETGTVKFPKALRNTSRKVTMPRVVVAATRHSQGEKNLRDP